MPRMPRVALLGGLALAIAVGSLGLTFTGGARIDWSSTSVFYTGVTSEQESAGVTAETEEVAVNLRVPVNLIGAASLALLGHIAKMMVGRHPMFWPEMCVPCRLKVPLSSPARADAAVGDMAGRSDLGRVRLPSALMLTACTALGLRAVRRRAAGSRISNSRTVLTFAASEGSLQQAVVVGAARPVAKNIPIQSAEQLPSATKFFRIMTDANQAVPAPHDVQQPVEFFRIMTDAEVPEVPSAFSRSVTVPCVAEEPAKKHSKAEIRIDAVEKEEVRPLMEMLTRRSTEPAPEEHAKPESKTIAVDVGQMGYVQRMRQKIEQRGLAVRAP